jgi:3-hydroxyisobutyrate dehydrogenase
VTDQVSERIGFVGLGNMGWPMARQLVRAGYDLTVVDADVGRSTGFASTVGGVAADSLAAIAADVDVVITMLPSSADVLSVLGPAQAALPPGAIVVEMSSGVPSSTRLLADQLAVLGVSLIDCPVSGGVAKAQRGELTIMAGGDPSSIQRVEPLLSAMGSATYRCGPVGSGHAMKALNNLVSATGPLVSIEALLLGQEAGLDPPLMVEVLNASTGMNHSTKSKLNQFILSGRHNSGFGLDLMIKDLGIALGVGSETGIATPLGGLVHQMWMSAGALLGPGCDHTEISQFCERLAGRPLARTVLDSHGHSE